MLKAVIFDVDGTLVDSVDIHAQAWVDAFSEFGHEVDFDQVRGQIGKGGDQLMPVFLSKEEVDEKGEELSERRGQILKENYLSKVKACADVRALFERIKSDGIQIVLASSAKADELETYKKIANIEDLTDAETSSDKAEKSKPEPDIFEAAMSKLPGIAPGEVIVVGDTPYDAEAARKAGLRTIGVLCGGFSEDSLRDAGCVAIYGGTTNLLAQYDRSLLAPMATQG